MGWSDLEKTTVTTEKIPYTKFEIGSTTIRILDKEPYTFWQHWIPSINSSAVCPGKDTCPICAIIKQQKENPNIPKKYSSTMRFAWRVWNYNTNQMEIMIMGKQFAQQLYTFHKEVGDLTTYDVKIIRNGQGKDTTYMPLPQMIKPFEFNDKVTAIDFATYFKPATKEEIEQLLAGKTWNDIRQASSSTPDGFSNVDEDIPFAI